MSFTAAEELRIQAIESAINDLQVALNKLPTKQQMKQLLNIRQAEIEELKTQVAALESAIQILQS